MTSPLDSLTLGRKITLVAAVVLLIDSFLPWYHASISIAGYHSSASQSGWHQIGVVAWLLVIVLLAIEGARLAGALPLEEAQANLASIAASALVLLFGVIYVIVRLSDGYLGFGFYIGIVGLVALAYGAFETYRSSDAAGTIKSMQQSSGGGADSGPADPPAAP